jgi:hypothetical protein
MNQFQLPENAVQAFSRGGESFIPIIELDGGKTTMFCIFLTDVTEVAQALQENAEDEPKSDPKDEEEEDMALD